MYDAESLRLFAAVKHFPGLGSASQSTEDVPAEVGQSLDDLRARDLIPFEAAIRARVPAVALSHGLYATDDFVTPGSRSKKIATDLLKRQLKFKGIAITDDLADPPITALGSVPDAAVAAVEAGSDMVYISGPVGDQQAAYVAVLREVRKMAAESGVDPANVQGSGVRGQVSKGDMMAAIERAASQPTPVSVPAQMRAPSPPD